MGSVTKGVCCLVDNILQRYERESGLYCDSDVIHAQCLGFLYTSILQDELHGAARFGNVHRIRPSSNPESPPGRPDILHFLSDITETQEF